MRNGSPPSIALGPVTLNVADSARARDFYEQAVGLQRLPSPPGSELLGSGDRPIVELRESPGAPARPPGTTGLFHLAVLQPDRPALAGAVRRLLGAGARLEGASDHLVSEAVYLRDPEGNGIEIYRDRPEDRWEWAGGEVSMATLPLDLESLLAEDGEGALGEARLGHVHMNVADLSAAVAFYTGVLGLDLTTGSYPGAAFVSAGGYHHHFGLNTWNGPGAQAPPAGALGLAAVTVGQPGGEGGLEETAARARAAGAAVERGDGRLVIRDPDGVALNVEALA